jgi:hypothetical protein
MEQTEARLVANRELLQRILRHWSGGKATNGKATTARKKTRRAGAARRVLRKTSMGTTHLQRNRPE